MKFGVCLNTQSAGMLGEWMKKPIAAGSLFLGKFQIDYVLTDALKSTRFGVPNSKEPVRITGWYKYQPGEKFTDMDMNVYPDRKDEASIYAVYYRNTDDKGESYVLDGHAVEDLDKLLDNPQVYKVARACAGYIHAEPEGDAEGRPLRVVPHELGTDRHLPQRLQDRRTDALSRLWHDRRVLQTEVKRLALHFFHFTAWRISSSRSSPASRPMLRRTVVSGTDIAAHCSGVKRPKMVEAG